MATILKIRKWTDSPKNKVFDTYNVDYRIKLNNEYCLTILDCRVRTKTTRSTHSKYIS